MPGVAGCISVDPSFKGGGDYHLQRGSLCAGNGIVESWMLTATDLAGLPRLTKDNVDMRADQLPGAPGTVFTIQ